MFGYFITNENMKLESNTYKKLITWKEWTFAYSPMNKFENDKLFFEDEDYVILLDGVIYNIQDIKNQFHAEDWKEAYRRLIQKEQFMDTLRGSFSGYIFYKSTRTLLAFTNHSGEKTVYYTFQNGRLYLASHISFIKNELNKNGAALKGNLEGLNELLVTGSLLQDHTPFEEVYRITAGCMVTIKGMELKKQRYHTFCNVPEHDLTMEECIEKGDVLFRQAVDRIFQKSREYGYQAECDLSGGLDSRMAAWVAHDLGYHNILNMCYCAPGNIDHMVSRKIAADLGNDYHFVPMDGDILKDIEKKVFLTGGQVDYIVSTGALKGLENYDFSNIGICCTGLLGEIQNAYWTEGEEHTKAGYTANRRSLFYELRIPEEYLRQYDNFEQVNLYEYSFKLFLLSGLVRNQEVEVASPFIDPDYLDFIYKVPLKFRKEYRYVTKWMYTKYYESTKYVWQTMRMPVRNYYLKKPYVPKNVDDIRNFVIRVVNKAMRITGKDICFQRKDDMNPFAQWYLSNDEIRRYIQDYYESNIQFVTDHEYRARLHAMFFGGEANVLDKLEVINNIAVWKLFIR